jgi:hypothetical protein
MCLAMHALLISAKMAIKKGISQDHNAVERMFAFMLPKFLDGIHKVNSSITFLFSNIGTRNWLA